MNHDNRPVDLALADVVSDVEDPRSRKRRPLKEVMARIGHTSTRAAMIYQHATRERDRAIAEALDAIIDAGRNA